LEKNIGSGVENSVLEKVFVPNREELRGEWGKLYNNMEIHD
jgi:hypothetical protein